MDAGLVEVLLRVQMVAVVQRLGGKASRRLHRRLYGDVYNGVAHWWGGAGPARGARKGRGQPRWCPQGWDGWGCSGYHW